MVIDWNFIHGVALRDLLAPKGWDFLIPECLIHEVLDKAGVERETSEQFLRKLFRFFCDRKEVCWIAKSVGSVCDLKAGSVTISALVEIQTTLELRRKIAGGALDFRAMVEAGRSSEDHHAYRQCENNFTSTSAGFSEHMRQRFPELRPETVTDEDLARMVRQPNAARRMLPVEWAQKHNLTDAQLDQFPDIAPIGRWKRIELWYYCQRFKKNTNSQRFSNCYADADAVFLSSFTGYLITNDKDQQKAAVSLRPDIRIWEWNQYERRLCRGGII